MDSLARERPVKLGVLVVDDDCHVRLMVQRGLERDGFEVWLAPTGDEAVELYRQLRERISVVLLDVRMPGLDGPATLDALRALDSNGVFHDRRRRRLRTK
jgi:CheY-like chemotaxis protein